MKDEFPKSYEAKQYEDAIYSAWEQSGFFNPDNLPGERKETFSIVLPPPNVTGTLHLGHAVMLAIEDIMTRYARMNGKKALWIPGVDHAAIATESKVEGRLYEKEGKTRHDLGREAFLKQVEAFAQESHDTIVNQMKKMGASVDWSREAYTLDEPRQDAVFTAFKNMYEDELIYRGARIVNWDPKLQTTVSDDEVERKEEQTRFYYFKYGPFTIGTSRPETKFGDKYVVMHPEDERYKEYSHGQEIELEWIHGPITATVIKDEAIDMEFGTGVMTITPWHDATDFAIAQRHDLDMEQIIDFEGKMLPIAGEFEGMDIKEARKAIVKKLEEKGLLESIEENYIHNIAVNSRGGGIIEPQVKAQWWIDVNKPFAYSQSKHHPIEGLEDGQEVTLKSLMQHAVRSKQIKIMPERFEKTYFNWIDNLLDWNISRQIWFGHQIPAWFKDGEVQVTKDSPGEGWVQDEDTLDTWFSSGLWTFSTLGWPNETEDLRMYHPTAVLETGYDIIFFWVARMILMSTYHMGEIPFSTVYLHGLVRDEKGKKMSKSLGNSINPLETIDEVGADATRLSLVIGTSPGNDSKLSMQKVEGYKHFTNKLWNISRYILTSVEEVKVVESVQPQTEAEKWIYARFHEIAKEVSAHLEKYEFSQAGEKLRDFTWNDFADWYIEIAKVEKNDDMLLYLLENILVLWHPFMPYVTEEIWKRYETNELLMIHPWVDMQSDLATSSFGEVKELITQIRSIRAAYKIPPSTLLSISLSSASEDMLKSQEAMMKKLARVENISFIGESEKTEGCASSVIGSTKLFVSLEGLIDVEKEKNRLQKEIDSLEGYIKTTESKLSNDGFVNNAPKEIVEDLKVRLSETQQKRDILKEQLASL